MQFRTSVVCLLFGLWIGISGCEDPSHDGDTSSDGAGAVSYPACCGCLFDSGHYAALTPTDFGNEEWRWIRFLSSTCELFCESVAQGVRVFEQNDLSPNVTKVMGRPDQPPNGDEVCMDFLGQIGFLDVPELPAVAAGCGFETTPQCCMCFFESEMVATVLPSAWEPSPCQTCWAVCQRAFFAAVNLPGPSALIEVRGYDVADDDECTQRIADEGWLDYAAVEYVLEPAVQ